MNESNSTNAKSETRDLNVSKLRMYQMEQGSLVAEASMSFVAVDVRLKTNRSPFPVTARAYDYLAPAEADILAAQLRIAARKCRAYRAKAAAVLRGEAHL